LTKPLFFSKSHCWTRTTNYQTPGVQNIDNSNEPLDIMSLQSTLHRASLLRRRVSVRKFLSSTRLCVTPEVEEAIKNGCPVVALESTIVAHGMPYPQNYQVAQEVESVLRSKGIVPATIAVKNGFGKIGLSDEELHDLARDGSDALKVSTRELSLLMGTKDSRWGATTVASTMILAHQAGISTFVTGGIGGVHRDGHISMDVSTDLTELSRTPCHRGLCWN
jgi:pseudouridine-5'-phosphate glycosidase